MNACIHEYLFIEIYLADTPHRGNTSCFRGGSEQLWTIKKWLPNDYGSHFITHIILLRLLQLDIVLRKLRILHMYQRRLRIFHHLLK